MFYVYGVELGTKLALFDTVDAALEICDELNKNKSETDEYIDVKVFPVYEDNDVIT